MGLSGLHRLKVNQEFFIPSAANYGRSRQIPHPQPIFDGPGCEPAHDSRAKLQIQNHPTFPYLSPFCLELWLEENDHAPAFPEIGKHCWYHRSDGDKGNVHDNQIDLPWKCDAMSRIHTLLNNNARISAYLGVDLAMAHVYCIHTCNSALEQAIRESARRRANVQRDYPFN